MFDSMMIKSLKHDRTVEVHSSAEFWQPPWQLDGRGDWYIAASEKNYSTLLINYCDCGKDCEAKDVPAFLLRQKTVVFKMKGIGKCNEHYNFLPK